MNHNVYLYILIMAITVFLIRVLPLTLIRKPIKNIYIRSFLYYLPYVTLALMVFPAIIKTTDNPFIGLCSLVLGIIASYKNLGLFKVTLICCLTVLILQIII